MTRNALDFVTAPDPGELARLELDALVYTGNARPSQAWVDKARALGVTVTFVQETTSTRSQQGYQAGRLDCIFAETRAKERGHAGSIAVVVSDGSWVDAWDCSAYGAGWQSAATLPFFPYGSVGCCESFNRGAPKSLGTWIPETWGSGTLLTQIVGPSPIPDTDHNIAHADYTGTPPPAPFPDLTPLLMEDDYMMLQVGDGPDAGLWVATEFSLRKLSAPQFYKGITVPIGSDEFAEWKTDIEQKRALLGTSGGAVGALHVDLAGTATPA